MSPVEFPAALICLQSSPLLLLVEFGAVHGTHFPLISGRARDYKLRLTAACNSENTGVGTRLQ